MSTAQFTYDDEDGFLFPQIHVPTVVQFRVDYDANEEVRPSWGYAGGDPGEPAHIEVNSIEVRSIKDESGIPLRADLKALGEWATDLYHSDPEFQDRVDREINEYEESHNAPPEPPDDYDHTRASWWTKGRGRGARPSFEGVAPKRSLTEMDLSQSGGNSTSALQAAYQRLMALPTMEELQQAAIQIVQPLVGSGISPKNWKVFQMTVMRARNLQDLQRYITNYILKGSGMGVQESAIDAIGSLLTEEITVTADFSPQQRRLKSLVESYGYHVGLL